MRYMKKTERVVTSSELRTVNLVIDSYEEKTMVGKLESPVWRNCKRFNGTTQLLMMVDQLLNTAEMESQSKVEEDICYGQNTWDDKHDDEPVPLAQFSVRVLYSRDTSWKGTVYWLDNKAAAHFRSVCELLILLDGALCEAIAAGRMHE